MPVSLSMMYVVRAHGEVPQGRRGYIPHSGIPVYDMDASITFGWVLPETEGGQTVRPPHCLTAALIGVSCAVVLACWSNCRIAGIPHRIMPGKVDLT